MRALRIGCWSMFVLFAAIVAAAADTTSDMGTVYSETVKFAAHRVGTFRGEVCCVGDFNNDGKSDILAGPFLYLAPDWRPLTIRDLTGSVDDQGKGYYDDFMNLAMDVDGDGLLDVVSCSYYGKRATWYRNTGAEGGLWPESVVENNGNFETGGLFDLQGNGNCDVILPDVQRTVWYELGVGVDGKHGFVVHVVSEKPMEFGGGVGDINGDGRPDILRPNGWFEAPVDLRNGTWIEHPLSLGGKDGKTDHTPQILVYDVNRDGLSDIITSSAHGYGILWYEQVCKDNTITWKQHTINDTWSQAHALALADINGDGVPELITGKRFMAHNGSDPGSNEPPGVYWYELTDEPTPRWTKHIISYNEGIGAGLNIAVADMNNDTRPDIVVTGKWGGPVWFENQPKPEQVAIWPDRAALGNGESETANAFITVYQPTRAKSNGVAVMICPGGGYENLVIGPEGHDIAKWLVQHGIAAFVLEYRLPRGEPFVPLLDAQRALRTVRSNAKKCDIDPDRIGIMGFSAGGHLAATAGTHFDDGDSEAADPIDRASCRPDFMILIYPVITMGEKTHCGSRDNLLGRTPKAELVQLFSNEKQVTNRTPPTFLAHAADDASVTADNSRMFDDALRTHKVAAEYLQLPHGGHGLNGYQGPMWDAWRARCLMWLATQKIIPQSALSSQ